MNPGNTNEEILELIKNLSKDDDEDKNRPFISECSEVGKFSYTTECAKTRNNPLISECSESRKREEIVTQTMKCN